ncbi:Membrane proteinase PrsW, cleaves anti-sigma factor RsiW, M82 family [Alteribacillus persepolensis]|uniref:Protease PrsW n=1 Tax=Alteribacillus persepolensis TaxID=568899 RepID=A0A1G7ZIS7_9BACI|nr:glutamic-type intramembrane protease PrsW [Alteribacillus persepolensis]SDH08515.1 Membrane proteinase PrsW, cleaves anti-sigma factor RsiW, M82 family [Alteribacillus persepolensis]
MIALIVAAIAPAVALLSYFYLKNKYDTSILFEVVRTFIIGALLVFPILVLEYALEVERVFSSDWQHVLVASAFLEEFFKWFLLFYTVYKFVPFSSRYDGVLYGAAISLGFASVENVLYLMAAGIDYAVGRALLPVSSHALFGVLMGYYIGCAQWTVEKSMRICWMVLSLAVPIVLHSVYDLILLAVHENVILAIVPFMFFLWWFALSKTKKANENIA